MGDPVRNCCRGIEALCAGPQVRLLAQSPFYWTEPVDFVDQDWFANAAIKIETQLSPWQLLQEIQAVQHSYGRKEQVIRFGPRILDLDIILYEDRIVDIPGLTLPHPRMHKRRFVLQPICDIDPSVIHPVIRKDMQTMLDQLIDNGQEIKPCSSGC
jgi:2-amino-4-hydroxy-6-hydroxymethyldihydropteridine diphosphokinase